MLTPDTIAAATADPAAIDLPTLERALLAFVFYPDGEGLSGFTGPDQMLTAFTDGVCPNLVGDLNPLPDAAVDKFIEYARTYHGTLFGFTSRDAAAMAVSRWQGFRERFAA